ncbi:phosphoenolpyruvate--protein phosphotransferase [Arcanobacterium pinnipediorum]|uniref:Phosphoenolpyruvate-protein phosphotransferase n=1 Tax=Arcanobacterium pinnipediorum TaxID=1503041 RepID=A0ABY5AG37_9ACTO|nr:phosphoenolpyruvate--protein phosphotransferase [Arcanobacterium pinnipediorum]USR79160.1 phosphoenolpyruvate--protein phosphotransferase [Arcanobacterium pinnipediorum]
MAVEHRVLLGIGVSAGTAHGAIAVVSPAPTIDPNEPRTTDVDQASETVAQALETVASELLDRAEHASEKAQEILSATAKMARDRGLKKAIVKELKNGSGLTRAISDAIQKYADMFIELGGYMAERATDLYDVRDRAIAVVRNLPMPGIPELAQPSIIVARDLAPAETATLDPEKALGIVIAEGGPTSHTAILAAQLGIPAAVRVGKVVEYATQAQEAGATMALDGGVGEVIIAPSQDDVDLLTERSEQREKALADSHGVGMTYDGHRVALLANIGTADDAQRAAQKDLEGSGLFRTEFLFLGREAAPSVEEQTEVYKTVFEAFGKRRVTVRTLDAGADKPLKFADLGEEENPALGRRGVRLTRIREDLMDAQLQALAAAYKATGADVRVMAPMIATMEEAQWFAQKARAVGLPSVGIMIEVPAAAINSAQLLSVVDFASIGTNDLAQYTMAADRMQGELASLLDVWQPAVLRMIRLACQGGTATGKYVGVCGEAGGDPLLALVLTGLGVQSLSMAPSKVGAVRAALKLHDLSTCQQMAAYALDAPTAADARAAVEKLIHPDVKFLL